MSRKPRLCFLMVVLFAVALVTAAPGIAQTVTVYQTNADQSLLLAQQPSVSFGSAANGSSTVTITPSVTYQQMDGFGAAMTDSSAYLIYNKLTTAQQTSLMQWFFSSSSGIGLNFIRSPMGASDFSAQGNFSYDDMPSGQTDVNLANFSIAKDLTYTIPVLKKAFAVNANIKVELLPWSPPAWMKTSGTMNGGNFNDNYYSSLAPYFVKAIQAYQAQGIPIYAIAAQNEPENSNGSYPTETFSASEEGTFIASYLGPALASASLSTKIFGYEHNWGDTSYPESILSNSGAYPYVAGTSWHCYSGTPSAQTTVQTAYPNKGAWFTECSGETNGSFAGDLSWGMENLIIGATRNYAKSVIEWNIALDQNSGPTNGGCTNCRGFVTINDSNSPATITYNVENYLYGHAAKFVVPGAYRVESNSAAAGAGGIEDVAFQNPNGSMVLIAFNDGTSSATFDVNWYPNNTNFSYTLPAGAVATFTWTPSGTSGPGAPSNLTATATSSSQINLSWTASGTSGVTYSVFRSTTSGFTPGSGNQVTSGLSGTTYSNTGLSSGTTYYYVVEALNSNGTSAPSNQASATTNAVVPTAPSGLTATAVSSAQINLSWTASTTPSVTYNVYRSTTSGFTPGSGNLVTSGLGTTTYSNTGLTASTTYYYVVEAVNSAGNSPASNQASAKTSAAGSGLSTTSYYTIANQASTDCIDDTGAGTSNGTVLQQWACSANNVNQEWLFTATSGGYYEVTTYNASTLAWNVVNSGTTSGTDMQLWTYGGGLNEQFEPVLLSSGYYEFIDRNSGLCLNVPGGANTSGLQLQISTCNAATSESFKLTLVSASAPAAPTSLTATATSSSQINLSWTASTTSGVTYNVYRATTSGFTPGSGNLITSGLSTTTYSNTGLTASTTYYYVVEAVDSAGTSPASNQASATTQASGGSGISTSAYYQIVNQASGLCIDDTSGSTSNGTVLQQYTCYANNVNQEWLFTATTGGYYEVTTYNSSTAAWNVVNNGTSPGTGMQLWAYGGGLNEQFEPVLLSSGYYELMDRNSGLCLNAPNNNNNQQLQINTCNGSTSESFKLNEL